MDALVSRVSQLDTEAAGALRVVMFYDTLMRRRVDLPGLARASAVLAECVVGIRLHGTGRVIRFSPDGKEAVTEERRSSSEPVSLDEEEIGTVWLERPDAPGPLDVTVLERLALAVAGVVERYGPASTTMADPALVELVVSSGADEPARARALRLLGFSPHLPVKVMAVRAETPLDQIGRAVCPAGLVKAARVADAGAVLATGVDASLLPDGVRAGIGVADRPDLAWHQARTALRFTTPHHAAVRHDELGALALLADVPPHALQDNSDVSAIEQIAGRGEDLATLEAYVGTGSVRHAAARLHLHHSSVARRLENLGKALGFELTEPAGQMRGMLALAAWRLLAE